MADTDQPAPLDRIDAAIVRIETAVRRTRSEGEALATRHAALRARMAEAVTALDEVIARETQG